MTTVTIIGADETCEVARLPHYEAGVQSALDDFKLFGPIAIVQEN